MEKIIWTAAAYLLGAIPFGLLIARANGVDIRKHGSGNIGATNVFRVVGRGWGVLTFVLDMLKGFVPAFFFPRWAGLSVDWGVLFGAAALVGHMFPVYLKFRGGKGVATGVGLLLGVAPLAVGVGFLFWLAVMLLTGYVSLSSMTAAVAAACTVWLDPRTADPGVRLALTFLAGLVIWMHRANIRRLLAGTENRFGRKCA